jgi:error-prone DNA polymerase
MVRPVDVNRSDWNSTLECGQDGEPVLRLGLRLVKGLSELTALRLVKERGVTDFMDAQDVYDRAGLNQKDIAALAAADALRSLAGNRHRARWDVAGIEEPLPLAPAVRLPEALPMLAVPTEGQDVVADYNSTGLTLRRHPMALLRTNLLDRHVLSAADLRNHRESKMVHTAGLVMTRQRPGSAQGVIFVTLEDETGSINLIVWDRVVERQRQLLLESALLGVWGKIQRQDDVLHVIVSRLCDYSSLLGRLSLKSRNFR